MQDLVSRRLRPFAVALVIVGVICIAIARLPDSLVSILERKTPFSTAQVGWAYRLLALAAAAQALYGGFVLLRPDRVERARRKDPKLARLPHLKLVGVVARTAASMVVFTIIYGIAAFAVGGQRGGFWLFPVLAVFQAAWYFRQVGQVAQWMGFQPQVAEADPSRGIWRREPPDYCPPLVRGLKPAGVDPRDP